MTTIPEHLRADAAAIVAMETPPDRDLVIRYGACVGIADPEIFFPGPETGQASRAATAKAICNDCLVRLQCLALVTTSYHKKINGIIGGYSEADRRRVALRIQRLRKARAAPDAAANMPTTALREGGTP